MVPSRVKARFTATVVLPVPPFPLATAITIGHLRRLSLDSESIKLLALSRQTDTRQRKRLWARLVANAAPGGLFLVNYRGHALSLRLPCDSLTMLTLMLPVVVAPVVLLAVFAEALPGLKRACEV